MATREQPLVRACRLAAAPVAGVLELIEEERDELMRDIEGWADEIAETMDL